MSYGKGGDCQKFGNKIHAKTCTYLNQVYRLPKIKLQTDVEGEQVRKF